MGDLLRPFTQSHMRLIVGNVWSGKTTRVVNTLDAYRDRVWKRGSKSWKDSNFLLFKHPNDDPENPGMIGPYDAVETDDPDDLADLITENTEVVVGTGLNHYTDPKIVDLLVAVVESGRMVYGSGTNLDYEGRPFNHMPELMAKSDFIFLLKSICAEKGCTEQAVRSIKSSSVSEGAVKVPGAERWEPRCLKHFYYAGRPDHKPWLVDQMGRLVLDIGPMFSGKSDTLIQRIKSAERSGKRIVVFKPMTDDRWEDGTRIEVYDHGRIRTRNGPEREAVFVQTGDQIRDYLENNPGIREVYIDEAQFIQGVFDTINDAIYQGYRFYVTGLHRDFKRDPFFDVPKLMTIADEINMHRAVCVRCGHPAVENQRLKKKGDMWLPVDYTDPIVLVGDDDYQARCLRCHELPGKPSGPYVFEPYLSRSYRSGIGRGGLNADLLP